MNSTTVLEKLHTIDAFAGHAGISIESLADMLGITVSKLVSLLTELEHRDEITMDISTVEDITSGAASYTGSVRLMRHNETAAGPDDAR